MQRTVCLFVRDMILYVQTVLLLRICDNTCGLMITSAASPFPFFFSGILMKEYCIALNIYRPTNVGLLL